MSGDDVQYTYEATSDGSGRARGFFTNSSTLGYGVNVQGNTAGVYGEALANSPGTRDAPNNTGLCGWGDNIGVIGLGRLGEGLGDTGPQPVDNRPTGVLGLAGQQLVTSGPLTVPGVVGVHGDTIAPQGTGVHGSSAQGAGVWGSSAGVAPLFGVFGQAQVTQPNNPYQAVFTTNVAAGAFVATGVLGIGDRYGGVFQATAPQTDPTLPAFSVQYANLQLTPIDLPDNLTKSVAESQPVSTGTVIPPDLPRQGNIGDVIVVNQTGPSARGVQVWVCLTAATPAAHDKPAKGALWARVNFDFIYETKPLQ